jgi:hypothetical protein
MTHPAWEPTADEWAAHRERMARLCAAAGIIPIPAICENGHEWIDGNGNGAIRAPSLEGCLCFWCQRPLKPHPSTQARQAPLKLP